MVVAGYNSISREVKMKLKTYNNLQIQRIKNFALICHEDPEKVEIDWVKKYSKMFSDKIKTLGIRVEG